MAQMPEFSSPSDRYDRHQIRLDQENIPSSPLQALLREASMTAGDRPKKAPTITPRRFTKFFTPRSSFSGRGARQSKAGQQLKDITKNGVNRRRNGRPGERTFGEDTPDTMYSRSSKRQKINEDMASSPPPSSPLKHVQTSDLDLIPIHNGLSLPFSDDEDADDFLEDAGSLPQPIRRLRDTNASMRLLQRSFGGREALTRGYRGAEHCVPWQSQTANFVAESTNRHYFDPQELPFCATSCNTNSLVAIGEEEGRIRLIDTSSNADFSATHVRFRPHCNAVMDIAFNSDDFLLASASGDQTARLTDMRTQQTVCVLSGHKSSVKQVRFQPNDDNILTTSSRDGSVLVWDLRCAATGSVQNLRAFDRGSSEDGYVEPVVRYSVGSLAVGQAHRLNSLKSKTTSSVLNSAETNVSVTAIQHLTHGREHLLLTASELSASVKLWDLRNATRQHRQSSPVSTTQLPPSHLRTRNFGINALTLSTDGNRLYTLCRDATVYVYATNHLALGLPSEKQNGSGRRWHAKEPLTSAGPLYGFKNRDLHVASFFIKAALRPARGDQSEMLAVGSTNGSPIIFPTDERHFRRALSGAGPLEDEKVDLPTATTSFSGALKPSIKDDKHDGLPVFEYGTVLNRAHERGFEVTSLCWSLDGALVTTGDDHDCCIWKENAGEARKLRKDAVGKDFSSGGSRTGWAEVDGSWDEEEG